jgi:hypothetical protein
VSDGATGVSFFSPPGTNGYVGYLIFADTLFFANCLTGILLWSQIWDHLSIHSQRIGHKSANFWSPPVAQWLRFITLIVAVKVRAPRDYYFFVTRVSFCCYFFFCTKN